MMNFKPTVAILLLTANLSFAADQSAPFSIKPKNQNEELTSKPSPLDSQQSGADRANTLPPPPPSAASAPPELDPVDFIRKAKLTPSEIVGVRKLIKERSDAQERPLAGQPSPVVRSIQVDLSPGTTPPIIRISKGAGATLVFTRGGLPAKVEKTVNFAANLITISDFGEDAIVVASDMDSPRSAAFGVRIKGVEVPLQFTVLTAQRSTDYRVDVYIPASGSEANNAIGGADQKKNNAILLALSNLVPDGYKKGVASSGQVFINEKEGVMIFRINGTLISPALPPSSKIQSPDGMKCYLLPITRILTVASGGQTHNIKIEGI